MKFCVYILKFSIAILLVSLGVHIDFFCFGKDGVDPIEIETIGMAIYTAIGIFLSIVLIRKAETMRAIWFMPGFMLYLLTWTFPAIFMTCYTILIMNAG